MKKFIVLLLPIVICSCVSQDRYDALKNEKDQLTAELQELKVGVPALLADGKQFFEAGDYQQAKAKFSELVSKHPERPETAHAKMMMEVVDEELMWETANKNAELQSFVDYASTYPKGKHIVKAKENIRTLKIQREEQAFEEAVAANSSSRWKQFIADYPGRDDEDDIKRKIIQCEVREIAGDSQTGELPTFNQTGFSNSATSSVSIKNDTQCELTVRYSGDDVLRVDIPAGGTRTVHLSSGSYQIAASACGANYAGREQLSGEYSSSYYIVTRRF